MKKNLIALTLGTTLGLTSFLAQAGVILSDDFSYPDGALVTVSAPKWTTHSGTASQVDVLGGLINITQAEGEDVNAPLVGAPYSSGNLYASFKATFTTLPVGTGGYFAHFKDTTTSGFRGRTFVTTTGAAAGSFRLGISAGANTFTTLDRDLSLNTTYTLVLRLDAAAMTATLWADPADENAPGATSTDTATALPISTFAFRQSTSGGNGMGVLTVDDLIVGTSFADVTAPPPATAPSITEHPQSQTVLEGSPVEFRVTASGTAPLAYQWRKGGDPIQDATNRIHSISSVTQNHAGTYDVVVSNAGGSTNSNPAQLTVNAVVVPPQVTQDPTPPTQTVNLGATVSYTVTATGTEPLSYQWYWNGIPITGQTTSTLTLTSVTLENTGAYRVVVSNSAGDDPSAEVNLTVQLPPPATIATLRALLDPVNLVPTNTTTLHTIEGTVTTHVNLTGPSANVLFYMQDATAGIAVFWAGGTNSFVPKAGDLVRVTAPLTHFNGLLELGPSFSNPAHSVTLLSGNNPLPVPVLLDFNWQTDSVIMERYEGSYVVVSNVVIDASQGATFLSGRTNGLTDTSGLTFAMFADSRTDIPLQTKPTTPVTILGVLGQFDSSIPRTEAYQIIPTRFADILSASKAPTIRFTNVVEFIRLGDLPTNSYPDHVLLPGERITIRANATDPDGKTITLSAPPEGLPTTARWTLGATTGTNLDATFTFQASAADAGQLVQARLLAANDVASNTTTWKIYVPTAAEQKVTVTEFLANPASTNTAAHFNPLHRSLPDPLPTDYAPSSHDEYVELVNLSATDLDLAGWTLSDSASLRHKFYDTFILSATSAIIVHGGPLNGYEPNLDVRSTPASENVFGFGLNNSGGDSIVVRNADGNIICRLAYTDSIVSSRGSVTRFPDLNGRFVPQVWVSTNNTTPGRQFDGRLWSEPLPQFVSQHPISVSPGAEASIVLNWTAQPGAFYTVWKTDVLGTPFSPRFYGLTFTNAAGEFIDTTTAGTAKGFYWISTP